MKIGFLTKYIKRKIDFAADNGFGCIELTIYPGDPLDPVREGRDELLRARDYIGERGLEISAIFTLVNCLDPDPKVATEAIRFTEACIDGCAAIGVTVFAGYPGRDPNRSVDENIPQYRKAFGPLIKKAGDIGVRIAFENCPKFHYFPFRGVNIAYNPRAWDILFDAIPSEIVGLEYDPSHSVSMFMDPILPLYRYADRIFHVHAKDAEILHDRLRLNGIFSEGMFRYRIPGFGDVDWRRLISALVEIGYAGNLDIEGGHDVMFAKEREESGLLLAKRNLERFLP